MLSRAGILIVAAALGAGSAVGIAGCGDERGSVRFEGDTGGTATAGTDTTGTVGTAETTTTEP
jgi:hypothetical protein